MVRAPAACRLPLATVLASSQIRGLLAAMIVALLVPASHAEESVTETSFWSPLVAVTVAPGTGSPPNLTIP